MAAELLLGHPLFPGETGVDQLVEIIKLLGTPTQAQVDAMNPAYTEFAFPQVRTYPWPKVFKQRAPPEAVDLISRMVSYVSCRRGVPRWGGWVVGWVFARLARNACARARACVACALRARPN